MTSVREAIGSVTIADLQRSHIIQQEEWCPDQKPDLSFRGNEMAGEVGEACNVIKKLERERHGWRGSRATKEQLAEELADVVHTAILCAITAGIDLDPAVVDKFNATSAKNGLVTMIDAAKPKHSPLPEHVEVVIPPDQREAILAEIAAMKSTLVKLEEGDREWGRLHQKVIEERAAALREVERLKAELEKARSATTGTWTPTHRQVPNGWLCRVICFASLQTSTPCEETAALVVYEGPDGRMLARPHDEFMDGRFEPLPPQAEPATATGFTPTHRHKRRGSVYTLLGIGMMQSADWRDPATPADNCPHGVSVNMRKVAIYRGEDGQTWVRPIEEFEDGRFEPIPPQAEPATAGRPSSAAPPEGQPAAAGGAAREADQ